MVRQTPLTRWNVLQNGQRNRTLPRWWPGLLLALCGFAGVVRADDATIGLVRQIPDSANAIAVVHVREILQSPRAQSEKWSEAQAQKFLAGEAVIPPWVNTLVFGAQVHPSRHDAVWSVAVLPLPANVKMEQLAERKQGTLGELQGRPYFVAASGSSFVELDTNLLGIMNPGFRQDVARWSRNPQRGHFQLSSYLEESAASRAHIVLALDVQDMLDTERVREHLKTNEALSSNLAKLKELSTLIAGLRGVRFEATVADKTTAQLVIDFSQDVSSEAYLQRLALQVISDQGLHLDEFEQARAVVSGKTLALELGELSDESLRRVLSLILTDSPGSSAPGEPPTPASDATTNTARTVPSADAAHASRRYFTSVNRIVDDLRKAQRRSSNYARTATWHENFADKIEKLPTADVDREVLKYGDSVAAKLRALAASLRGVAVAVDTKQRSVTYEVNYDPGWQSGNWWGSYSYRAPSVNVKSNLAQVREQQAELVQGGTNEREQIWSMIDEERSQTGALIQTKFPEQ